MLPAVSKEVMKPLVPVKTLEKKLVEVDCVVVDCKAVKFCRVVEPASRREPRVTTPLGLMERAAKVEVAKVEGLAVAI